MAENGTEQLLYKTTSTQPATTENESHQDDISDAEVRFKMCKHLEDMSHIKIFQN